MAINVLITRSFKKEFIHDAHFHNAEIRALATVQPGYISGTTMVSVDNPQKMLIVSSWEDMEKWKEWYESDMRKDYYKKLRSALESPEHVEAYILGATASS